MNRREIIAGLGSAAAWPVVARAQQRARMRRIGVLLPAAADDAEELARNAAFLQGLQEHGWTVGRNVQIDYRFAGGDADRIRGLAAELVALTPDVILASGGFGVGPLQRATSTIPIVFVNVTDPVGAGFVASLARPGGNATGFEQAEYRMSGKWLGLLKQIASKVTRAAVLRDAAIASGSGQLGSIQTVAPSFGVELRPVDLRGADEIERGIAEFAREPHGGMIVTAAAKTTQYRDLIVRLAAEHRLPAVYPYRYFASSGGLISYGPDIIDQYRRAAAYIDRILMGEKPADLPVQAPTKYETVINLKTAKALGLTIPETLLATADEVIQ